jgi:hypothetical protein
MRTIMPSGGSKQNKRAEGEDPRLAELREINARLATVISFLEAKQTPRLIETSIAAAESYLNDHTPSFVRHNGSTFKGTRHVGSLLQLCDLLEVKAEMGTIDTLSECTSLLERKVNLLRDIHSI